MSLVLIKCTFSPSCIAMRLSLILLSRLCNKWITSIELNFLLSITFLALLIDRSRSANSTGFNKESSAMNFMVFSAYSNKIGIKIPKVKI